MRINVELLTVVLGRFRQNVQIGGGIGPRGESQPHRRPTVLMVDEVESLFVQVVVDINPFWATSVGHAVVADEDDVDDLGEVASLQSLVEVLGENVDGLQRILFSS